MRNRIISCLKSKEFFILIGVILFGLFFRIYNLSEVFYYTMDEEVMNLIQRRIVLLEHFPLIGSVSPLYTYLGPYFYYFGTIILFLSNLSPFGQGIFATILGSVNIILLYIIAKELFSKKIALIAALLYSTSFLQIIFDRRWWHLSPGPTLSLLVLWSLYKIKQGNIKFIYLLTAALIFGWNTDYTNLVLFLFVGLAWILFKLPVKRKEVVIAITLFILSNLPLVIFDLRHDFLNVRSFISYFQHKSQSESQQEITKKEDRENLAQTRQEQSLLTAVLPFITYSRLYYVNSEPNISYQHTYCKQYIFDRNTSQGIIFPLIAGLFLAVFIFITAKRWKQKDAFNYKVVIAFYLIFQLGILFYSFVFKGDVFEHYMSTLLPYFHIVSAVVLVYLLRGKIGTVLIGLIIAIITVVSVSQVTSAYNPFSWQHKMDATKYALEQVGEKEFSLDSLGSCFRYDGYYYPFLLFNRHPVKSYQDPNYSWLYNYPVAEKHPSRVIVMVSKGKYENNNFYETYNRYQQWVIERKQFGGIEVLVLNNDKGDFH